jgi:hypothetical protein
VEEARRAMFIRILIGLFIACVVLYVLSVPFTYDQRHSPSRITSYKYCPNCGTLYYIVGYEGEFPSRFDVIIEGRHPWGCKHELLTVDIAGFLCAANAAQKELHTCLATRSLRKLCKHRNRKCAHLPSTNGELTFPGSPVWKNT